MFGTRNRTEKKPFGERLCGWMMAKMEGHCPCEELMAKFMERQEEGCGCGETITSRCGPRSEDAQNAPTA
jgi:hypothetical protein